MNTSRKITLIVACEKLYLTKLAPNFEERYTYRGKVLDLNVLHLTAAVSGDTNDSRLDRVFGQNTYSQASINHVSPVLESGTRGALGRRPLKISVFTSALNFEAIAVIIAVVWLL